MFAVEVRVDAYNWQMERARDRGHQVLAWKMDSRRVFLIRG